MKSRDQINELKNKRPEGWLRFTSIDSSSLEQDDNLDDFVRIKLDDLLIASQFLEKMSASLIDLTEEFRDEFGDIRECIPNADKVISDWLKWK